MTRKLEELFDLPSSIDEPILDSVSPPIINTETLSKIDKIESALPEVRGLESSDQEMDDLAQLAVDSYKDLMDLGMNVDSRFAAEVLGVASSMLSHAITAKTAKMNKKLKMIDLQLKKLSLDQRAAALGNTPVKTTEGTGHVLDRNELLQKLLHPNTNTAQKE
jgi:hypothetical protein